MVDAEGGEGCEMRRGRDGIGDCRWGRAVACEVSTCCQHTGSNIIASCVEPVADYGTSTIGLRESEAQNANFELTSFGLVVQEQV